MWIGLMVAVVGTACESPPLQDPAPTSGNGSQRHVVFDTDLAFDDVMALLYLLGRDDVVLDAVTITGTGEVHCEPGVRNARALLMLGGSPDTPVACGRETPLAGSNAFPDPWREASDNLSEIDLPTPAGAPDPRDAVELLLDTLDGSAALITVGPLTNVAEALRADPGLAERVPVFIAMAGAVDVDGNAPDGVSEYNVWADPLAASEVVDGMAPTLVPLDATNDVPFTPFFAHTLRQHLATPEAEAVGAMLEANEDLVASPGYSFWDSLATVLLFEADLATWRVAPIYVNPSGGVGGGQMNRLDGGRTVRIATGVPDPAAFEREYLSVLTGETIEDVRPDPAFTVTFDGSSCKVAAAGLEAGRQIGSVENESGSDAVAVVVQLNERLTYQALALLLGPPGSVVDQSTQPKGLEILGWLEGPATEADVAEGTLAVVCIAGSEERQQVWLSPPIEVP
jgi:pyrimidine-specific ribonucleoside hydrolase